MRCARPGADEYDFRACACEIIRRRGMRRARRCRCDDGDIDHWRGRDKAGRLYIGGGGISLLLEIAQAESRELAVAASAEISAGAARITEFSSQSRKWRRKKPETCQITVGLTQNIAP